MFFNTVLREGNRSSSSLSLFHHKTVFIKRKRLVLLLAMSDNKQNRLGVGAGRKKAGGQ